MSNKKENATTPHKGKPFAIRLKMLLNNENSPLNRSVSQSELANHLNIARQSLRAYIEGATLPDMEKFKQIADFFQVSYDYLLGSSDSIRKEYTDLSNELGINDINVIDNIKKCNEEGIAITPLLGNLSFPLFMFYFNRYINAKSNGCIDDLATALQNNIVTAKYNKDFYELAEEAIKLDIPKLLNMILSSEKDKADNKKV